MSEHAQDAGPTREALSTYHVILGRGSENGDGDLRYLHCETLNYCATEQH